MNIDRAAGALLVGLPIAFNLFFFLLGRAFDYPGILRSPHRVEEVIDFYATRELAQETLKQVLEDEPGWAGVPCRSSSSSRELALRGLIPSTALARR